MRWMISGSCCDVAIVAVIALVDAALHILDWTSEYQLYIILYEKEKQDSLNEQSSSTESASSYCPWISSSRV